LTFPTAKVNVLEALKTPASSRSLASAPTLAMSRARAFV
jgi:hypothetical protein